MKTNSSPPLRPQLAVSLKQLLELFVQLLVLQPWTPPQTSAHRRFYDRLWTPLITLWYLLWQVLHTEGTLQDVVGDARRGGADALVPGGQKLSQRIRSRATTAFCKARQRLPLAWVRHALAHVTTGLRAPVQGLTWHDLTVGVIDGSTVRLRPHGNISKRWTPARNQHGAAYWCLLRVVVAFCAGSGLVLSAGVGPLSASEQALAVSLILRATAGHLWVGDRNFGVWRIVRAALQTQGHALVRLTETRARRLLGRALTDGLDQAVQWTPTRHDQADAGLARQPVAGRLLVRRLRRPGFRDEWLVLFTTLTDATVYPAAELFALYGERWQAELNLRALKTHLGLEQLEVKSAGMALKTWSAGLLAYNLVRGVMLWAAAAARVSPQTLSFAQARRLLRETLRDWGRQPALAARAELWEQLQADLAAAGHPKRRKPRPNEPRAKYHVRESFPPLKGTRAEARRQLHASIMES